MQPETFAVSLVAFSDMLYQWPLTHFILWFLGVYVVVLVIDIILIFYFHGARSELKKVFYGTTERPFAPKKKIRWEWKKIETRLKSRNPSDWKVAILEADRLTDRLVGEMGYAGNNLGERLKHLKQFPVQKVESIEAAHSLRNRIVFDGEVALDQRAADHAIAAYRSFLKYWEVL